jgi:hypothetical protein
VLGVVGDLHVQPLPLPDVPLVLEHHGGEVQASPSEVTVDAFSGQHTNVLDHAAQGGAPCSTSCVERSDRSEEPVRPVAVQNGDDPTNAHPGGTPSG